jgi:hypothetical protein
VTITLYSAEYLAPDGRRLCGSVFSDPRYPGKTLSSLCQASPTGLSLEFWKAYRSRTDGEGQRQLQEAMTKSAHAFGYVKAGEMHTHFTRRIPA